jgi:hypothetical protein
MAVPHRAHPAVFEQRLRWKTRREVFAGLEHQIDAARIQHLGWICFGWMVMQGHVRSFAAQAFEKRMQQHQQPVVGHADRERPRFDGWIERRPPGYGTLDRGDDLAERLDQFSREGSKPVLAPNTYEKLVTEHVPQLTQLAAHGWL